MGGCFPRRKPSPSPDLAHGPSGEHIPIPPGPRGRITAHHFEDSSGKMQPRTPFTPEDGQIAGSSITARNQMARAAALASLPGPME